MKQQLILTLLVMDFFTGSLNAAVALASPNYPRAAEPVVAPALTPLPLGAVEPSGWLRDWAVTMKEGITGHLDERHKVFRDGWKLLSLANCRLGEEDGTGWPIEQCAYWLDGATRLGYLLHDEALIKKMRARLDPVVDGVNRAAFGTTFIYWKTNWTPTRFDSWAHSHMGRALLGLYSGSGDQRVLDALVKVYADYPVDMGAFHFGAVSGFCNLDPMLETYALSGDKRILERALAAAKRPVFQNTCAAWGTEKTQCGHLVVTYENLRLPAVVYPWTGDAKLLEATRNAFRWLEKEHQMPYGLASGEEWVGGVGAGRKTETCNIPAMLLAADRMYRIEGDGSWGDRMEKAFFNAGPSPVSRDGKTAAYYQAPNRIRLGQMPRESDHPGPGGIALSALACSNTLCCISACTRILPQYIEEMWMATGDRGLAAALYGPCIVNALAGDQVPVKITSTTDYPFNETIRLVIAPQKPVEFPLFLRIPGWCTAPEICVNGKPIAADSAPRLKGFARVVRTWQKGDEIALRLPMTVSVARGTEGPYPSSSRKYFRWLPDSMFSPRALPFATVNYGPLLFCLPIPEKDDNTPAEGAQWQYALDLAPADAAGLTVIRTAMPVHWDWPYQAPLSLKVPARAFDWNPEVTNALPVAPVEGGTPKTVNLVPYGCTKFHVSMFPVTPRACEGSASKQKQQ